MSSDKNLIRNEVRNLRNKLNLNVKKKYDSEIYNKIINLDEFKNSQNIFTFISYKKEVDTKGIIEHALGLGKTVLVPKVISLEQGMRIIEIKSLNNLVENSMGILEPKSNVVFNGRIDLVIMPGMAFSKDGGRVGYGGGFYDRYLSNLDYNVVKVALAYSFQIFDEVPMECNDIYCDYVVTENNLFRRDVK